MGNKTNLLVIAAVAVFTALVVGIIVYLFIENKNLREITIEKQEIVNESEVSQPAREKDSDVPAPVKSAEATKSVSEPADLETSSFVEDSGDEMGFVGVLYATGYATTEERKQSFCEENCPVYTLVNFIITKTDSEEVFGWLNENRGNSFLSNSGVGLGCLQNGSIKYSNVSDQLGFKEYTLSAELTKSILSASKERPTNLKLERMRLSSGFGVSDCYSHFTKVSLAQ